MYKSKGTNYLTQYFCDFFCALLIEKYYQYPHKKKIPLNYYNAQIITNQ